ncbi:fungal-specific transcription factor domain-containing protein [Fusarium flagelliforme]|uniref:fungal-specific transcription factor domain-containing protein n=1 Tax=Fusarium flagelliforme TaxID=2675880 RepID=UPI001E8DFE5C|nr:fungal-specific transcription factor domain-containing protein [Fusarium flagelliforme]KAH7173898.1 fungal-specific transcription factor domain-containing protein [Fusarium flagelliforme]
MVRSNTRPQRTSAACDFCRRRKLGCDNAKPKCENCQARDLECTYTERPVHARPSNARINMLEKENARLREQLRLVDSELHQGHGASKRVRLDETTISKHAAGQEESQNETLDYSPTTTGQPEGSAFHGPSSGTAIRSSDTVSGDIYTPSGTSGTNPPQKWDNDPTQSIKNQLLAETVRQRQLESVNQRAGKLNFRGIESKVGMDLLSNFWNRQLYTGPIVYRTAFMRDMANNGPYFSELLLYAMLFAGSQFTAEAAAAQTLAEVNATGRRYRAKFEQILHSSGSKGLFKSEVTTIQALLVMSDALFSWCNERSLSWHYMGLAINMIIDLGLHTDHSLRGSSKLLSGEAREIERRLFWAAFVMDKVQSIYQGRPTRLHERDTNVPIAFLDDFEELESFSNHTYSTQSMTLGSPTYGISTFEHLSKLSIVVDDILCQLYSGKGASMGLNESIELARTLDYQLELCHQTTPTRLWPYSYPTGHSSVLPHTLSLLALYRCSRILIWRSYLSGSGPVAQTALSNCVNEALEIHPILVIYKQHYCFKTAPHYISYAAYVSASIFIRIAAQKKSSDSQAHSGLRLCMEVLSIQQAYSHGTRRMMKILLGLMDRLGVHVGEFVALQPSGCNTNGPDESNMAEPVTVVADAASHIQNTFGAQEQVTLSEYGIPIDFSDMPDLGWPNLDFDKLMNSFVFNPFLPAQQETPGLGFHNELFGLNCGTF